MRELAAASSALLNAQRPSPAYSNAAKRAAQARALHKRALFEGWVTALNVPLQLQAGLPCNEACKTSDVSAQRNETSSDGPRDSWKEPSDSDVSSSNGLSVGEPTSSLHATTAVGAFPTKGAAKVDSAAPGTTDASGCNPEPATEAEPDFDDVEVCSHPGYAT